MSMQVSLHRSLAQTTLEKPVSLKNGFQNNFIRLLTFNTVPSTCDDSYLIPVHCQLPVSRAESVPGFQMHSEDFLALPGTSKQMVKSYSHTRTRTHIIVYLSFLP